MLFVYNSGMAEMTIRLRCDPETGKRDIIIALESDADALPQEHEALHRRLVEKLIGSGLLTAEEAGKVIVEREERKGEAAAAPVGDPPPARKSAADQN
jgi:hypothetical protein